MSLAVDQRARTAPHGDPRRLRQASPRGLRRKRIASLPIVEWDEFGQAYGDNGLLICICGEIREDGDWSEHYCPYAEPEPETAR